MLELTAIQNLDFILGWLAENADTFWTIQRIVEDPSYKTMLDDGINEDLLHIILEKLVKDGYTSLDTFKEAARYTPGKEKEEAKWFYKITFDGLVFYEQGGYQKQQQIEREKLAALQREREYQERQTKALKSLQVWIVIATVVAGLYYLVELLKYFSVLPNRFAP